MICCENLPKEAVKKKKTNFTLHVSHRQKTTALLVVVTSTPSLNTHRSHLLKLSLGNKFHCWISYRCRHCACQINLAFNTDITSK